MAEDFSADGMLDMYMYENNIDKECRFDVCEVFVNSDNLKLVGINYIEDAF